MQAVVLAGGKGSRLAGTVADRPKPLAPLLGLPVLDHLLGWLAREGVSDVVVCSAYLAPMIEAALGDGTRHGLRIRHRVEAVPLGTAGALKAAADLLDDRFFVVYGDTVADVDLRALRRVHLASGAEATLVVHPNDHPFDSDRVVAGPTGALEALVPKHAHAGPEAGGLCNAALCLLEKRALDPVPEDRPSDLAHDLFPALLVAGRRLQAHRTVEYIKDMGTPARMAAVEEDLRHGVPASLRMHHPKAALLLDRDGVLIEDVPYLARPEDLRLLPGAAQALARLNRARILTACCTNQPVVARGALSLEGLHGIHRHLEGLLGAEGAWLDAVYACPHHPDRGFPGERPELKIHCDCRKPEPGMLRRAVAELGLDPAASIFVGDRPGDLLAASRSGILGVGVLTGAGCRDLSLPLDPEQPVVPALEDAVAFLLDAVPSWDPWVEQAAEAGLVCIGGPSRAGKTLAAAALRLALHRHGRGSVHLSLDRFIAPAAHRTPGMGLEARLGFEAATGAAAGLREGRAVLVPGYDPRTRAAAPGRVFTWNPEDVLILDGLLAPLLPGPALRVALSAPPDGLAARLASFRAWKQAAGALPWTPDAEEVRQEARRVAEAASAADLQLAFGPDFRLRGTP